MLCFGCSGFPQLLGVCLVCVCFHLQGCAEILAQIECQGDGEVCPLRLRDTALLEALLDAHMELGHVVFSWVLVGSRGRGCCFSLSRCLHPYCFPPLCISSLWLLRVLRLEQHKGVGLVARAFLGSSLRGAHPGQQMAMAPCKGALIWG